MDETPDTAVPDAAVPDAAVPAEKPRGRFQYSLRSLLIVVTAVAIAMPVVVWLVPHPTLNDLFLCLAAAAAGVVNAIAGGGTLLTFPALYAALAHSGDRAGVLANGTSTVALWPAAIASMWAYRREVRLAGRWTIWLLVPSLIGGLIGVLLVTWLPASIFDALVPWLILSAAILFAIQPRLMRWTGVGQPHEKPTTARFATILGFQFFVAIYGGYFGAGIGILMLAALAMMGLANIHTMNGLKNLLGASINLVAGVMFIVYGDVEWRLAVPMLVSSIIGGYFGAWVARLASQKLIRRLIVAIGFCLAAYYFYKRFAPQHAA